MTDSGKRAECRVMPGSGVIEQDGRGMAGGLVRLARESDLHVLREIERGAGQCFADIGMAFIAEDEPPSIEALREFQSEGQAWVWADTHDLPVAYLLAELVDGCAHLEQVSVHPDYAHRRIGRALMDHLADWARAQALQAITLATFTEVPWNGPYYARCGFRYLTDDELTPGLRAIRTNEAKHGLDQWPRACMRREL